MAIRYRGCNQVEILSGVANCTSSTLAFPPLIPHYYVISPSLLFNNYIVDDVNPLAPRLPAGASKKKPKVKLAYGQSMTHKYKRYERLHPAARPCENFPPSGGGPINTVSDLKKTSEVKFKMVDHTVTGDTCMTSADWGELIYKRSSTYYKYSLKTPLFNSYFPITSLPSISTLDENMLGEAFRKIQPNFETFKIDGINIYTMILELADLKKLFTKSVFKFQKSISTVAEKNLLVNFGILPVMGDLQAIYGILTKMDAAIDKWNAGAKKGITWDFHSTIYSSKNSSAVTKSSYAGVPLIPYTLNLERTNTRDDVAKAHLYARPVVISDRQRSLIKQSVIGLERPILGAWEAVPFSWAVDYFFHFEKLIAAWDQAMPSMFTYKFVDAGYSLKQQSVINDFYYTTVRPLYTYSYSTQYKVITHPPSYARSVYRKRYQRVPVSLHQMNYLMSRPPDYKLGWDKGWRQASYLASVAYLLTLGRMK